jgi:hypothetical protein
VLNDFDSSSTGREVNEAMIVESGRSIEDLKGREGVKDGACSWKYIVLGSAVADVVLVL